MSPRRAASSLALLVAVAAGCGDEVTDRKDLEKEVKRGVTRSVGQAPKAVQCPDELKEEVGATTRCTLIDPDDTKVDVVVTVTSVKDGKTRVDIKLGSGDIR